MCKKISLSNDTNISIANFRETIPLILSIFSLGKANKGPDAVLV
jgi:hypothetical protein